MIIDAHAHIYEHLAAYGDQMQRKMCALIEENVRRYLSGQPLKDRIL